MLKNSVGWLFGLVAVGAVYAGCTQDFSSFEPTAGSGGSSSTKSSSNTTMSGPGGGGGSGGCQTVTDCPTPSNPCEVPTCQDTKCGTANATDGATCSANNGHVCFGGTCVGCLQGGDCGTQSNDCMQFNCQNDHTCMLGNKMDGSSCGAGMALTCAGGTCGGCTSNMSCGTATECVTFTCTTPGATTGVCSSNNLLEGMATPDQTANDCMKNICHNGVEEAVVDQTDTPANASPCQTGSCSGQGMPGQTNNAPDSACVGMAGFCNNANPPVCVGCTKDGDCNGNDVCFMSACCTPAACSGMQCDGTVAQGCGLGSVTCTPSDCTNAVANEVCDNHVCCAPKTAAMACAMTKQCAGNAPDGCGGMVSCAGVTCGATASHCVDGFCCDTTCTGACVACNVTGMEGTCSSIPAGTDPGKCDNTNGGCANGDHCSCDGDGNCKDATGGTCTGNGDCASGMCACTGSPAVCTVCL